MPSVKVRDGENFERAAGRTAKKITSIDERKLTERLTRIVDTSSPRDQLNRSIIALLQQDGRMAFAEIAQALAVSEGTIRNRVNSMKQAGMLRIVAIADPVAVEYKTDAMLGLKIAPGHTPQAVAERSRHPGARHVSRRLSGSA